VEPTARRKGKGRRDVSPEYKSRAEVQTKRVLRGQRSLRRRKKNPPA
jgi:hypothetical protein